MRLKFCSLAGLAMAIWLSGSGNSHAALVLSVTATNNTTTTTAGPGGDSGFNQSLAVTNAGASVADTLGSSVSGSTRYISNVAADRPIAFSGSTARRTINTDYTLTISTSAPVTHTYNLIVNSSILGELTLLDDIAAGAGGAQISDVTGRLNGSPTAGLSLTGIAENFSTGTGVNDAQERNKSASNSINLGSFVGPQNFSLRFTFSTEARSPQNVGGGDEAAVRLGANGPLGGATADDYPGPGDVVDRIQANDGHFVSVTATITAVPEPSSALLALSSLIGLCGLRRRRA
jgi:hypothetical protein